jgi:hypothetical protein
MSHKGQPVTNPDAILEFWQHLRDMEVYHARGRTYSSSDLYLALSFLQHNQSWALQWSQEGCPSGGTTSSPEAQNSSDGVVACHVTL